MNQGLLSRINAPTDLAPLSYTELIGLASEIRQEILQVVGNNGGHLASNLGVIELTLAMHRVFSTPNDEIVWDVGHQSYPHKLITGRFSQFCTLRLKDGISGFPKREESIHDSFNTGHASTSISAALGILEGKRLQNKSGKLIAVIGDGALTGGMAFEALSNAGELKKDLIIILNDNQMSIGKNTGALSQYLSRFTMHASYQRFKYIFDSFIAMIPFVGTSLNNSIRLLKRGVKGVFYKNNVFADLGFEYVGPLDGHNIRGLEKVLRNVKKLNAPAVVHVRTVKGKGYSFAENNPAAFHGIGPFNLTDGSIEKNDSVTFTQAFAKTILEEAKKDDKIAAITAAMTSGTGLEAFKHLFPKRFYDVGIAEEHAVTFAAGLAVTGIKAVVAIYSTFLQRAVDQIIHDVALQNLHVIFAADRAGAVPHDGETHQGLYDIALFRSVPNMTILCPASEKETGLMLEYALKQNSPVLLRYPKASCPKERAAFSAPIESGRGIFLQHNKSNTILLACTGGIYTEVFEAANILAQKGIGTDIYNIRFAKPVDEEFFLSAVSKYRLIVFAEDGCKVGGVCEYLESVINKHTSIKTYTAAFPDAVIPHGSRHDILYRAGLAPEQIAEKTEKLLEEISVTCNLQKGTVRSPNC